MEQTPRPWLRAPTPEATIGALLLPRERAQRERERRVQRPTLACTTEENARDERRDALAFACFVEVICPELKSNHSSASKGERGGPSPSVPATTSTCTTTPLLR